MIKTSDLIEKLYNGDATPGDIENIISCTGEDKARLFARADEVRKKFMGDGVLLRGVVEFSSYCRNTCLYCGLNKNNTRLERYRLSAEQVMSSAKMIHGCGIKTLVLQSGEDEELDVSWLSELIAEIKKSFGLSITLSVGERDEAEYRLWRKAGADRYLLKIETSDEELYTRLHPSMSFSNRLKCLDVLKDLGYQVGSGIIIGLKNQTKASLARDIMFFKERDFDMIGIGPFIPHSSTELCDASPGDVELTLKVVAATRICLKNSHIPSTTALGSIKKDADFRIEGLRCGANVLMPNFTPQPYRKFYEIYPNKKCIDEKAGACSFCMEDMVKSIGRHIDYSVGDTLKAR
jgi:biotin synthase